MPRRMQTLHFTEGSATKHFEKIDNASNRSVGIRAVITPVVASVMLTAASCSGAASVPKAAPFNTRRRYRGRSLKSPMLLSLTSA